MLMNSSLAQIHSLGYLPIFLASKITLFKNQTRLRRESRKHFSHINNIFLYTLHILFPFYLLL